MRFTVKSEVSAARFTVKCEVPVLSGLVVDFTVKSECVFLGALYGGQVLVA